MALSFHLTDAQHQRFLEISADWVEAQCNEDVEPEGAMLLLEYSVIERNWIVSVQTGSQVVELGPVKTTET